MMNAPCESADALVSVIVPVYNVAPYLPRCVESILVQTHANLDVILVDDGSTDGSGALCDAFAARDARVRVIHKRNEGQSCARNAGLDHMRGDLLAFVDADDYVSATFVEALLDALVAHKASMSICGIDEVDDDGHTLCTRALPDGCMRGDELWERYYQPGRGAAPDGALCVVSPVCKLYRASVFSQLRFPAGMRFEDLYILPNVIDRCDVVCAISAPLYHYVQRQGSTMRSAWGIRGLEETQACLRACLYLADHGRRAQAASALVRSLHGLALSYPSARGSEQSKLYYQSCLEAYRSAYRLLARSIATPKERSLALLGYVSPASYCWARSVAMRLERCRLGSLSAAACAGRSQAPSHA